MRNQAGILSVSGALRAVGITGFSIGVLTIVSAVIAYAPGHPEFSVLTTYLSDIGDTAGWPQITWNSGTILAAPFRYLVLVLFALRLRDLGNRSKAFYVAVLGVGAVSTLGTVLMTAVPFSVGPAVHKTGIACYFLGVVILQSLIGARELKLKAVPRLLPALSFTVVTSFLVFVTFLILYETGAVGRSAPVIWEWLCALSSLAWVLGHSIVLGSEGRHPSSVAASASA
jgi:hypothetical membrane protein